MATVSKARRMASTAAPSAAFLSPRPIQREAASAAASVTRTSSSARLRSTRRLERSALSGIGASSESAGGRGTARPLHCQ